MSDAAPTSSQRSTVPRPRSSDACRPSPASCAATWLRSDTRREALQTLDPLVEGQRTLNVVDGFAGWFTGSGGEPLRWKQAVAVLIALYPTTLTLGWLVLMPRITALLGPWLRRRPG